MTDPFAVLDELIEFASLETGTLWGSRVKAAREALEAIRQEREEALAAHLEDCPVLWKASVDWGEQLEAAERKLAALREAAGRLWLHRGSWQAWTNIEGEAWQAADDLRRALEVTGFDVKQVALEGEAG